MLHGDGTVSVRVALGTVSTGLSNVVAVSSGLALQSDATVVGLDGMSPTNLTNVIAISGDVDKGLVVTRNPPLPVLLAHSSGTNVTIAAPVSVSGYILEAAETPTGPFSVIETFTNAPSPLTYTPIGPRQYFRLRKL
jgi:hypothetical protein